MNPNPEIDRGFTLQFVSDAHKPRFGVTNYARQNRQAGTGSSG